MSRPPTSTSTTRTLADGSKNQFSLTRKLVLLFIFFLAHLMDIFNNAALFPAIPILEKTLHTTQSQYTWLLSAFELASASFLLISGRISDIYDTKIVFITSLFFLGVFSLGAGFASNITTIIVLRALIGVASAMSMPSVSALLVRVFPEPLEQARAIGAFGACSSIGHMVGSLVGAFFVQHLSYHWIFWLPAIVSIPLSFGCMFIIPVGIATSKDRPVARSAKWKSLDLIGVFILTVALILFIYALTTGPVGGWSSAGVLAPLIISIFLIIGFAYWETLIPFERAVIPPCMWSYSNFTVLFGSALFPAFWWSAISLTFTTLWQDVFRWTAISATVHMLPSGISGLLMGLTGGLSRTVNSKWIILVGFTLAAVSTVLCAEGGGRPENYWPYVFPALVVGSAGAMLIHTHTSVAIFHAAPESIVGMVGAISVGAGKLGAAVGIAAFNAIESSVQSTIKNGEQGSYEGREAAFWFLLCLTVVEFLSVSFFYDRNAKRWGVNETQTRADDGRNNDGPSWIVETTTNESDKVEDDKIETLTNDELKCLPALV